MGLVFPTASTSLMFSRGFFRDFFSFFGWFRATPFEGPANKFKKKRKPSKTRFFIGINFSLSVAWLEDVVQGWHLVFLFPCNGMRRMLGMPGMPEDVGNPRLVAT